MINITERLPCSLHGARQHCSQKLTRKKKVKGRVNAKVAVPLADSTHLSLGTQSCVQKSMLLQVITQVFLPKVLTEVLSMLRTGLPNGKCPHGGF